MAGSFSNAAKPKAIIGVMTAVADWQLANPSAHRANGWQVAPFWVGLFAFAPYSGNPEKYLEAVRRNGEANDWKPGPQPFFADDQAITQSYFLLYTTEHKPQMIEPALKTFQRMLHLSFDESLEYSYEKTRREWVWCDALFMSAPALVLATYVTGDHRYTDLMNRLWWKTTDYLYDKQEHLYYRDSRFFSEHEPNGEKVFWSRGNGWVLAGLARVLQYLPEGYPARRRFVALFQEMAQRIASLQTQDGYWRASLLDPESTPKPETSGTAFFTYALAWGINRGVLDRASYESNVRKGWSALVRAVDRDGMLGYVQRTADRPGTTGPNQTEVYGVGAFLLAGSEVYRLSTRPP
jgi:unsaturated rhamnogalacturonyl hydrolase